MIEQGRSFWNEYHESIPRTERPGRKQLLDTLTAILVEQTQTMIKRNISPVSGAGTDDAWADHAHLQNYTIHSASLVEWSPIVDANALSNPHRHYLELVQSAYDAYISLCTLNLEFPKHG